MLSTRLQAVADFVTPKSILADIGTDHAYLPIELIQKNVITNAIASDIGIGPLKNAEKNIRENNLENQIITRLGSGVDTINANDNVDTVVLAGMGGKLIVEILRSSSLTFEHLIIEANIGEKLVRQWLFEHDYQITGEKIVAEDNHVYEIIDAYLTDDKIEFTTADLIFGPELRSEKSQLFLEKWQNRLDFLENLRQQLVVNKTVNQEKLAEITNEINLVKEELA